jgi:hypothetical protein
VIVQVVENTYSSQVLVSSTNVGDRRQSIYSTLFQTSPSFIPSRSFPQPILQPTIFDRPLSTGILPSASIQVRIAQLIDDFKEKKKSNF